MRDTMFITIVDKVDHYKATASTHFAGSLRHCRIVKGCRIGIDCIDVIALAQILESPQNDHLRFGKIKY